MNFFLKYKYIIVCFLVWNGIQIFKVAYESIKNKKLNLKRYWGAGGMPSSHSATVTALAIMIGCDNGFGSAIFALAGLFAMITMYDACGVRRAVGKQAKVLNDILMDKKLSGAEKLQEMTGHTPFQVAVGALIGVVVGIIASFIK